MNLYEFEGKHFFEKYGIAIPKGKTITRFHDPKKVYTELGITNVVVKAQVLSGKRGKNNAIRFCSNADEVAEAVVDLFSMNIRGQYVVAIRIEEKLDIAEEHYLLITYNTNKKQPMLVYCSEGGVDIEDVSGQKIFKQLLYIRNERIPLVGKERIIEVGNQKNQASSVLPFEGGGLDDVVQKLWSCFLNEDCRLAEINPLVYTTDGKWIAVDAKVAIDDDAFFRHEKWKELEPRTMLGRPATDREIEVQEIDKGEKYYQGTAGKYIEMDGDIALILNGGGASIANMDVLNNLGLKPANYTEYSGNPPREKVYELVKIVLSKPGIRGLWMCGAVANFTNVKETFGGVVDALDEIKPTYPIVVRRAGPHDKEGMALLKACGERNQLNMKLFGKDVSMGETAKVLADMIQSTKEKS